MSDLIIIIITIIIFMVSMMMMNNLKMMLWCWISGCFTFTLPQVCQPANTSWLLFTFHTFTMMMIIMMVIMIMSIEMVMMIVMIMTMTMMVIFYQFKCLTHLFTYETHIVLCWFNQTFACGCVTAKTISIMLNCSKLQSVQGKSQGQFWVKELRVLSNASTTAFVPKSKPFFVTQMEKYLQSWGGMSLIQIVSKHGKNCKCCPVSLFIVRSQLLS